MKPTALKPGVRVCPIDEPGSVGIVTAVRGFDVKVLWRGFISRWHDAETVIPTHPQSKGENHHDYTEQ